MNKTEALRRANIHEWVRRYQALLFKGMSVRGAETVVDAAMFGVGCTEGEVRAKIEKAKVLVDVCQPFSYDSTKPNFTEGGNHDTDRGSNFIEMSR